MTVAHAAPAAGGKASARRYVLVLTNLPQSPPVESIIPVPGMITRL